jgi:hypothetical protein
VKKIIFFLLTAFFLFFSQIHAEAAPPQEQYSFNDVKTIVGNSGEFAEQIVFERTTSLGESEFNPGSEYANKTRARLKSGCYLVLLRINSFNGDGTEGKLVEKPVVGGPTNNLCDPKVQQSFLNKTIRIDTTAIKKNLVKDISITVNVKTTAQETKQIPPAALEDEITIEGPTNNPAFPSEVKKGSPAGYIKDAGIIIFELHSTGHEPGKYKACSKVAQACTEFTKTIFDLAKVQINSNIVIEGIRTGSGLEGDTCRNTLDCAEPLSCTNGKCGGGNEDPPPPPEPPCAEKNPAGECEQFSTALGSFATDPGKFVASVFAILLAASGAIALILIMRAGYKIMTSQGKPDTIQEGREQLIAAVVGLLFLIFSLVFLEVIGVDILQIPGSGGAPRVVGRECKISYPDPSGGRGNCEDGLICSVDSSKCSGSVCNGTCSR